MYLKTVEMIGFKSFAEKVRVELKPGITAIVGPNGSGKSNVAEAIRWCIGEMSWKSLRSDAMIDVIFAGTQRRSPLNLAEVNLVFDNASSLLPVQYSEVTVTRRIFRSGESEYYLNRAQCRLRDVRELFLDTGIGGEGYAIIDQGGVDFVLSSKPEDRRALFEEAAGVSKYKAKREEALRKLEKVDQDTARLSDSIALINEQIRKLDNDARKARLYQKYKVELSALEAKSLVQEHDTLQAELDAAEGKAAPLRQELEDRRTSIEGLEAELATLSLERASQEEVVLKFSQTLSTTKEEIGRLEERSRQAEQSSADVSRQRETLAAEIDSGAKSTAAIEPELERLAADLARQQALREEAEKDYETSRQAVIKAEEELARLKARAAEIETAHLKLAQQRQDLARELSRAESEFQHHQVDLKSSLKDLEKQTSRAKTGEDELTALRADGQRLAGEAAAQKTSVDELDARQKAAVARLAELDRLGWELKSRRGEQEARLEALERKALQDPWWAGGQAVLAAGLPGVLGRLRQFLEVDDAHRAAVEVALGESLDAILVEEPEAARSAIEFLRTTGKGRCRFVVLSAVPEPPSNGAEGLPFGSRPLLTVVRSDAKASKLIGRLLAGVYAQAKDVHGPWWVSGGSDELPASPVAEREDLRREIEGLKSRQESVESEKGSLRADLQAIEATLVEARQVLKEADAKSLQLAAAARERESLQRSLREEAVVIERQIRAYLASIGQRLEARKVLHVRSQDVRKEEEAGHGELQQAREAREALQAKVVHENARFGALKTQRDNAAAQVSFYAGGIERLQEQRQALAALVTRKSGDLKMAEARAAELEGVLRDSKTRLTELYAQQAGQEEESRRLFEALDGLRRQNETKAAAINEQKGSADDLQSQLHELELATSQTRARQEIAVNRLRDEHQLTPEQAKAAHAEVEATPEGLSSLRQRIARLGNVNMAAPEEYEALNQRQGFLDGQLADLAKAKADLQSAIQKINATTRENFRQTFEDVREHFRKIYGSLFEGGEADLILTDPENMLETGVEVFAQPPGKKLQSITLLSGGEKTLTAISLLFAFFTVKPSPFCIMDEADAALDEANVERFVQLLKDFAKNSQFLVISHNKRTMEAADVLYGITMEESGVSQVISVELRRREIAEPSRPVASKLDSRPEAATSSPPPPRALPAPEPAASEPSQGREPADESAPASS